LWSDGGALTNLASDYKARSVGDLVVISIVEQTLAQASGTVASQRTFNTKSGITGLVGRINTGGVNPLVGANSDTQLKGQAQAASTSSLRTSVAGQVIAVLPNGNMVVEAHRDVLMNNERQTVILRGVARPGDLAANNVVLSSQLSNLEVELRGKGVISDGTRRPNWVVRALLRLVTF
jgi:flagellar L-ring protein precursor FlgH